MVGLETFIIKSRKVRSDSGGSQWTRAIMMEECDGWSWLSTWFDWQMPKRLVKHISGCVCEGIFRDDWQVEQII
jgi:hypothetical protein